MPLADQFQQMRQIGAADIGAGKVNFRALALLFGQVIVKRVAAKFEGGLGAEVRAADTDHDQHLTLPPDSFGGGFDALVFSTVVLEREVEPTQKFMAGAFAAVQYPGSGLYLRREGCIFFRREEGLGRSSIEGDKRHDFLDCLG